MNAVPAYVDSLAEAKTVPKLNQSKLEDKNKTYKSVTAFQARWHKLGKEKKGLHSCTCLRGQLS
eukprot:1146932-Pelagomonas_calceolata.AAC.4